MKEAYQERQRKNGGWECVIPGDMVDYHCVWRRLLPCRFTAENAAKVHTGTKTQTRRLFKFAEGVIPACPEKLVVNATTLPSLLSLARWPVGTVLWIQQPWWVDRCYNSRKPSDLPDIHVQSYGTRPHLGRALMINHGVEPTDSCGRLRPAMFMQLRLAKPERYLVTEVRVERVNEISEVDALAEGIEYLNGRFTYNGGLHESRTAVEAFSALWNSIHRASGIRFEDGPWVFAYTFKKILQSEAGGA